MTDKGKRIERLFAYSYYFGPKNFLWVKKGFQPIMRILLKFWKFNIKHSPLVKIYKFLRNRLRNN